MKKLLEPAPHPRVDTLSGSTRLQTPLLEVEGLRKCYGDIEALSGISFSVRAGEILGIIGSNGAGQTTLMECLAGLLPPDSGSVRWQGATLPRERRKQVIVLSARRHPTRWRAAAEHQTFNGSRARGR